MARKKSNPLTNKDKLNIAFDLYLNTDKTQAEICEIVDWAENTFTRNKREGNWDELKSAQELTSNKIITNIYKRLQEITESGNTLDPDKIIKLAKSIESLSDRKVTVSNIINVFKEFTGWLMTSNPEMAKQINEQQKLFVSFKINGN